jgi:biotin transport system substrate-specific component
LLGSRLGAIAIIAYLAEGAIGLPFFAGGHFGLAHLVGPTGGYLISFPAAAFITGAFAEHGWDRRFWSAAVAMAIGSAVILFCGWAWFAFAFHAPPLVALWQAVTKMIPGDVVKIIAAAAVLPSGWKLLGRQHE